MICKPLAAFFDLPTLVVLLPNRAVFPHYSFVLDLTLLPPFLLFGLRARW